MIILFLLIFLIFLISLVFFMIQSNKNYTKIVNIMVSLGVPLTIGD